MNMLIAAMLATTPVNPDYLAQIINLILDPDYPLYCTIEIRDDIIISNCDLPEQPDSTLESVPLVEHDS